MNQLYLLAALVATIAPLWSVHGQAPSTPDVPANADFCKDQSLSDGKVRGKVPRCSTMVMGQIPNADKMVSTVIVEPKNGAALPLYLPVDFKIRVRNMELGSAKEESTDLYGSPQRLNKDGHIIGHQHIVVQRVDNPGDLFDSSSFELFQRLHDKPNDQGELAFHFEGGFNKTGHYRICTMAQTTTHQPVLMPVAQRGAQDDCIRVTVGAVTNQKIQKVKKKVDLNRALQESEKQAQLQLDQLLLEQEFKYLEKRAINDDDQKEETRNVDVQLRELYAERDHLLAEAETVREVARQLRASLGQTQ